MLDSSIFYKQLEAEGIAFSAGVPDSLLKNFCAYLSEKGNDIITANEGGAIALAAGYHMATHNIPLVYMQNSGFGNIVNPLTSLVDKEVYSIPMLLMIGWRGEPGIKDEPQHRKQGRISEALLDTLEIKYAILSKNEALAKQQVKDAFQYMRTHNEPYAFLVQKDTFGKYELEKQAAAYPLSREAAIHLVLNHLSESDIIVSTTGKASREVFEYRANNRQSHSNDFLTVGCMGHASKIALGIALHKSDRTIVCLDGDGAAIMHLGAMAIIGSSAPPNFKHILLNNGSHDSVGGQPTVGHDIDFLKIAEACNYKKVFRASTEQELKKILPEFLNQEGPLILEIKIAKGARADLGRPTKTPIENKKALMANLKS